MGSYLVFSCGCKFKVIFLLILELFVLFDVYALYSSELKGCIHVPVYKFVSCIQINKDNLSNHECACQLLCLDTVFFQFGAFYENLTQFVYCVPYFHLWGTRFGS